MESKIASSSKLSFEPVAILWSDEKPEGALQFSGLATLAGVVRDKSEEIFRPAGAVACQQMGIYLYREEESKNPRAILGFTDLAARKHIRRVMGDDMLTFAVPYRLFLEMETEVENGLLDSPSWEILTGAE
ncbi:hypothetical protein MSMTP_2319 [Methanosarcina sp. MTP4]|uniref:DUF169 domain-containing protein n=1 Tax=Methanosarcina sp. MTP4 TaxID=1434100 RepID=UPI000615999C|nr:DUF169 domain-containing protein [Methanosarcina sp. MTP4]AKB25788.1 hypothetical protein MSMTP_2319 [Methanosarcina sp. MTP4]